MLDAILTKQATLEAKIIHMNKEDTPQRLETQRKSVMAKQQPTSV
jgi:hypothetical protein